MGRLEGQIEEQLIELKGEMSKQKPDHSVVTTCLETIRGIAIGAAEPAVMKVLCKPSLRLAEQQAVDFEQMQYNQF